MEEVIIGWKNIARSMGMSLRNAQRKASMATDPMPVRKLHGGVYAHRSALEAWRRSQSQSLHGLSLARGGANWRVLASCNDGEK